MTIEIRNCKICDTPFTSQKWYKKETCSRSCGAALSIETKKVMYGDKLELITAKRISSNLAKYGVESTLLVPSIQEQIRKTTLKKYGTEWASQSLMAKNKSQLTCLTKYGVTSFSKTTEFLEKSKNTNLERHGVDNVFKNTDMVKKSYIQKLGVTHPMRLSSVVDKCKATNTERYGSNWPQQAHIPENTNSILENKDWLETEYTVNKRSIESIATECEVGYTYILNKLKKFAIPIIKNISDLELDIGLYVAEFVNFEKNCRDIIGLELDIYIPEYNLAIECNGSYWHSELNGKDKNYHLNKTTLCNERGIHLLHIWEHDWKIKQQIIKSKISSLLGKNKKIYARKCTIREVNTVDSNRFLYNNHIQGVCASSTKIGLYFENELVTVMTFGKSRFNKNIEYELLRYASLSGTTIIGGASKSLQHFLKTYSPKSVISYSDKAMNKGNMYKAIGFTKVSESPPGYKYTKNYSNFYPRVKFQKHKLPLLLENVNMSLTEWDNMKNNGYDRIWDCGNDVFTLSLE